MTVLPADSWLLCLEDIAHQAARTIDDGERTAFLLFARTLLASVPQHVLELNDTLSPAYWSTFLSTLWVSFKAGAGTTLGVSSVKMEAMPTAMGPRPLAFLWLQGGHEVWSDRLVQQHLHHVVPGFPWKVLKGRFVQRRDVKGRLISLRATPTSQTTQPQTVFCLLYDEALAVDVAATLHKSLEDFDVRLKRAEKAAQAVIEQVEKSAVPDWCERLHAQGVRFVGHAVRTDKTPNAWMGTGWCEDAAFLRSLTEGLPAKLSAPLWLLRPCHDFPGFVWHVCIAPAQKPVHKSSASTLFLALHDEPFLPVSPDMLQMDTMEARFLALKKSIQQAYEGISDARLEHALQAVPLPVFCALSLEDLAALVLNLAAGAERLAVHAYAGGEVGVQYYVLLGARHRVRAAMLSLQALLGQRGHAWLDISAAHMSTAFLWVRQGDAPVVSLSEIEGGSSQTLQSWDEDLMEQLVKQHGRRRGESLYTQWRRLLPGAYRLSVSPVEAVQDLQHLQSLKDDTFHIVPKQRAGATCLKLYRKGVDFPLSDVIPLLSHMGLRVKTEQDFCLPLPDTREGWVHALVLETPLSVEALKACEAGLNDALQATRCRGEECDALNQLIVTAGLSWQEVRLLRAYDRYLKQLNVAFGRDDFANAVTTHATCTKEWITLFHQRFDPALWRSDTTDEAKLGDTLREKIQALQDYESVVVFTKLLEVLMATMRTTFYQSMGDAPSDYLGIKLDVARLEGLPLPQPRYEIFVYASFMEGVHLRSGKVSRGGLRASDRADYRNEVLDLMRTQALKNAVIVPDGAKGGFVTKTPALHADRTFPDAYETFIRGLLDLTDNVVDGEVRSPPGVRCRDDDDTYLVVAADKGTATRSDDANRLAQRYAFWLGDAFASGGSAGYDHKKMGITARGTWVSVQHHFARAGLSLRKPFSVVGVGDMSGDVFGNGMLLSKKIKLVAAFNHRHIFVDPDPDPATSFKERQRLFRLPGSTWKDYGVLSPGGFVVDRQGGAVTLTEAVRKSLGCETKKVSRDALVQAILKAPVDLMWLGGVGTFIKAADESEADIPDTTNRALRVTARDLRVRVIGEGANLGLTEDARIEAAGRGIRLNTDAIDNAAGVTCSDYEVNIKILLDGLLKEGAFDQKKRAALLKESTKEVEELVLQNNQLQNQAISLSVDLQGGKNFALDRLVANCADQLSSTQAACARMNNRLVETSNAALPRLTRPEIATLLAYSKMRLAHVLQEDDLLNEMLQEALLEPLLLGYFPPLLTQKFRRAVLSHPLRKNILATGLANALVNTLGPSCVNDLVALTRAPYAHVLKALVAVVHLLDFKLLGPAADYQALDVFFDPLQAIQTAQTVRRLTVWFLQYEDISEPLGLLIARYEQDFRAFRQLSLSTSMAFVSDLSALARSLKKPLACVAHVYADVCRFLSVDRSAVRDTLEAVGSAEQMAFQRLTTERDLICAQLTQHVVQTARKKEVREAFEPTKHIHREAWDACHQALQTTQGSADVLSQLVVQVYELKRLYERVVGACLMTPSKVAAK